MRRNLGGRIDDRFLSSVERRAPAQRRQTTETDRLSYQAYAADPRQEGQLIFRIARKTRDNIRRSESRLDISLG